MKTHGMESLQIKLDEHITICKPVVIMCTGGKSRTRIHEFKTGPGVSAVRVAVCCVGELGGSRDVVYCWLNDVERRIRPKFKHKRRRKQWLRPASLVFHCTS